MPLIPWAPPQPTLQKMLKCLVPQNDISSMTSLLLFLPLYVCACGLYITFQNYTTGYVAFKYRGLVENKLFSLSVCDYLQWPATNLCFCAL